MKEKRKKNSFRQEQHKNRKVKVSKKLTITPNKIKKGLEY